MSTLDTLGNNIESLIQEHSHHLEDELIEDMVDLSQGLSLAILVLAQNNIIDQHIAVATATAYLRAAYGVGYNKGYTDGQDAYEEIIRSKEE